MSRRMFSMFSFWGIWTLCALITTTQLYIEHQDSGTPMNWGPTLIIETSRWYLWGLLTPLIIWLAKRVPVEREHLLSSLPLHIVASILLGAFHISFEILLDQTLNYSRRRNHSFWYNFIGVT